MAKVKFSVVLVEPKYPGNIGSVARVMKNFGFSELVLVKPPRLGKDARKMAMHAQDVLANAIRLKSFDDVVERYDFVVGTSDVSGTDRNSLRMPIFPEDLKSAFDIDGRVALVFGREADGLSNEELKKCDSFVMIPTDKKYPTLNIAMSVGIILYELSNLGRKVKNNKKKFRKADVMEKRILFENFGSVVDEIYPYDLQRKLTKKTFKTLFGRAFISGRETTTLIGLFRRIKNKLGKKRKNEGVERAPYQKKIEKCR